MKRFTEWLNQNRNEKCITPELDPQEALNFLSRYLLRDHYHFVDPLNSKQGNTLIVEKILHKYSKDYKKEYKAYMSYMSIIGGKIE